MLDSTVPDPDHRVLRLLQALPIHRTARLRGDAQRRAVRTLHRRLAVVMVGLWMVLGVAPAVADFRLCNNTGSRVGIAVGYKDQEGWTTEGWWNLSARTCETLMRGSLVARYYYIYAIDYDRGGEWSGRAFMCTREKEFTIRGTQDCLARGYDRTGFFEVDTTEQRSWTVQLTESAEQQPSQIPMPSYTPPKPGTAPSPTGNSR